MVTAHVDPNISDLFFNTEHSFNGDENISTNEEAYFNLREEAREFLACLDRLGVPTPSVDELVKDFFERL